MAPTSGAIQGLLRARGIVVAADGVFGVATQDARQGVPGGQRPVGDGVVGDATWLKLVVPLRPGSSGEAVLVLQRQLNAKRNADLTVNGIYDTATRNAVIAFQKHVGMTPHGGVGPVTWRNLLWHYDYPSFTTGEPVRLQRRQRARPTGRRARRSASSRRRPSAFVATGHGRVSVGDASYEHGGNIPLHETHEVGLDVDVRPIRKAEQPVHVGHELAARVRTTGRRRGRSSTTIRAAGARPRQAHLLQRPGPHPRGPDDAVRRATTTTSTSATASTSLPARDVPLLSQPSAPASG